ncbi:kinase-like domain-containing protein [Flagelloscypha sp. PMI_526]|nr:kinase-like domain-containing protein [Flagelloscypha sp. PMI_526]
MLFLAENTRIPVPSIYKVWTFSTGIPAFLMQWFDDAFTLEERWPMLSESDKSVIAIQVHSIINELRNIPQPRIIQGQICQFDGSACWDERLKSQHCGPFSSEKSFNDFRLSLLDHFYWEPGARMQIDQLRSQLKSDHRIVLTHGDLAAKNILLDDSNTVIALLDWEMSGWRPEHWEIYTRGTQKWPEWGHSGLEHFEVRSW